MYEIFDFLSMLAAFLLLILLLLCLLGAFVWIGWEVWGFLKKRSYERRERDTMTIHYAGDFTQHRIHPGERG